LKPSRYYQNGVQIIGSFGEILLFLAGVFLGKEMMITAIIFLSLRVINKLVISEFMYRRMKAVVKEEGGDNVK